MAGPTSAPIASPRLVTAFAAMSSSGVRASAGSRARVKAVCCRLRMPSRIVAATIDPRAEIGGDRHGDQAGQRRTPEVQAEEDSSPGRTTRPPS